MMKKSMKAKLIGLNVFKEKNGLMDQFDSINSR